MTVCVLEPLNCSKWGGVDLWASSVRDVAGWQMGAGCTLCLLHCGAFLLLAPLLSCSGVCFETAPWRATGSSILRGVDDIQQLLDDQVVKTQAMRASPYIGPFEEQVKAWEAKLNQTQVRSHSRPIQTVASLKGAATLGVHMPAGQAEKECATIEE